MVENRDNDFWTKALQENPKLTPWYEHWQSSLNGARSPLHDELPWMTYAAIDWLQSNLRKDMILFEWGSGGSTAFFARRVKQVITVEHDSKWYESVVKALGNKGYKNTTLTLSEPTKAAQDNRLYISSDTIYAGHSFEQYVRAIDSYPDSHFDIVVVDGRARPDCIQHSLSKIKPGGYLLLDNSERLEYERGWKLLQHWEDIRMWGPGPYNGYPWETRIWQKSVQ